MHNITFSESEVAVLKTVAINKFHKGKTPAYQGCGLKNNKIKANEVIRRNGTLEPDEQAINLLIVTSNYRSDRIHPSDT